MLKITPSQLNAFRSAAQPALASTLATSLRDWNPARFGDMDPKMLDGLVAGAVSAAASRGLTLRSTVAGYTALTAALGPGFDHRPPTAKVLDEPCDTPDDRMARLDATLADEDWAGVVAPDQPVTGAQARAVAEAARTLLAQARKAYPDTPLGPVAQCAYRSRPAAPPPPGHWIEVVALDEEDHPLPDVQFQVKAADGQVWSGSTDEHGIGRITGLAAGPAQICFPDLDRRAWRPL